MKLRDAMIVAQGGVCFYCGKKFKGKGSPDNPRGWTREHLIPKSAGGKRYSNLVMVCFECNQHKAATWATDEQLMQASYIWRAALIVMRIVEGDATTNHIVQAELDSINKIDN